MKARNPGWEHRLYDDERAERLIRDVYGDEMLAIYHKISPDYLAARVDLLCNLIIYDAGGVYLDIKSTFERPLDEIVKGRRQLYSGAMAQWAGRAKRRLGPASGSRPHSGRRIYEALHHRRADIIPTAPSIIQKIIDNVKTIALGVRSAAPERCERPVRSPIPLAFTRSAISTLIALRPRKS